MSSSFNCEDCTNGTKWTITDPFGFVHKLPRVNLTVKAIILSFLDFSYVPKNKTKFLCVINRFIRAATSDKETSQYM